MSDGKKLPPTGEVVSGGADLSYLSDMTGFMMREEFQTKEVVAQYFGVCYEQANRYAIAPLPSGRRAIKSMSDEEGWTPTMDEINSMGYSGFLVEDSPCFYRSVMNCLGCSNLRAFEMPLTVNNTQVLNISRPCAIGGFCCCPHTVDVKKGEQVIARVEEDINCSNYLWRYLQAAYCCKVPYNVQVLQDGELRDRYQIDVSLCCFGAHNNFCGATPCKSNMLFDVYEIGQNGVGTEAVGQLQKTYGAKGGLESLLRCCFGDISNYIVQFPANASPEERAGLVGANILLEYLFFSSKGQQ